MVVAAILAGDVSTVSDKFAKKAKKGLAADIKEGNTEGSDFEKLKEILSEAKVNDPKPVGARKLVMVEGKKKKVQFFVVKEGSDMVIAEITISK